VQLSNIAGKLTHKTTITKVSFIKRVSSNILPNAEISANPQKADLELARSTSITKSDKEGDDIYSDNYKPRYLF
jgi:hypothetical protein